MRRTLFAVLALHMVFLGVTTTHAQTGGLRGGTTDLPQGLSGFMQDSPLERARLLEQRTVELLGTGVVDPDVYVLGPGDLLGLDVAGAFSLSVEDLISADGSVTFSQFGTFALAGLTLTEARKLVLGRGQDVVRDATLGLTLKSMRAFKVYVVGEVAKPGAVRATAVMRVSEALAAAGGPGGSGDLRNINYLVAGADPRTVDLLPFTLLGDMGSNPTLIDGVTLVVPRMGERIEMAGAVQHRGYFSYVEGDELGSMLRMIGLSPGADSSRVVVQRFSGGAGWDSLGVDLRAALAGDVTVPLMAHDRVLIRFRGDWRHDEAVRVIGAVHFPGPLPVHRAELRVADVIRLAGGPIDGAVMQRVVLGRPFEPDTVQVSDPTSSRTFLERLSGYRFLEATVDLTVGPGPLVEPGDIISVPRASGFVQVLGQVKVPGFYDYNAEWDYSDYLEAAGGWAKQADKSQTRVTRGHHGQVVFASDVGAMAPGDILWVPEKRPGNFWVTMRDATTLVISAATLYLLIEQATN